MLLLLVLHNDVHIELTIHVQNDVSEDCDTPNCCATLQNDFVGLISSQ